MAADTSGTGRLNQADFIRARTACDFWNHKTLSQPKMANPEARYAAEFPFYNAVTPDQEGVSVIDFGRLGKATGEPIKNKIIAYEVAQYHARTAGQ